MIHFEFCQTENMMEEHQICIYLKSHLASFRWSNMVFDGYSWLITIVTYLSPFIVYNAYKHGLEGPIAIGKLSFTPLITLYGKLLNQCRNLSL